MSFIEGTKIFSNRGFIPIEELSGHDKVLVRNFIGDAEFIQPFALHKSYYDGIIHKIGGQRWSFSVTPDHLVVYDKDKLMGDYTFQPAKDVECSTDNRIYRKFRYILPDDYKPEQIVLQTEFGKKFSTISNQDWFTLCGYYLKIGQSEDNDVRFYVKSEEDTRIITDILDRIGISWSMLKNRRYFIRASNKSNLAKRIATRMGSKTRKKIVLSDKMLYNSSKQLAETFFKVVLNKGDQLLCGEELADSLVMLGTIHGYGVTKTKAVSEGEDTGRGPVTRDIYKIAVYPPIETFSPRYNDKIDYKGNVYSIDLFEGQVYVRNGTAPVWIDPK